MPEGKEQNDGNPELARMIRESITRTYEAAFAASPERARCAQNTAQEVVELLLTELENAGLSAESMQQAGLDIETLRRVVSWGAFDYSCPKDGGDEVVEKEAFVAPFISQLAASDMDFAAATSDLETSIIAMRVHRKQSGLGKVRHNPTDAFIEDYIAVSGSPLPDVED